MRRALALLAVAGCGQVLGIDAIPYAGPGDAPGSAATDGKPASDAATTDAAPTDGGPEPLTLTVQLTGSGSGTVTDNLGMLSCPGTCTVTYPIDSVVKLTETATAPNEFVLWRDACLSQNVNQASLPGTCNVTATGAVTVTAQFELGEVLALVPDSPAADIGVSFTDTIGGYECASGSACAFVFGFPTAMDTIVLHLDTCLSFEGWIDSEGECAGASPSCTVHFDGELPPVRVINYALELNPNGGGSCSE